MEENTKVEVSAENTAEAETMSSCLVEFNQLEITLDKTVDIFMTNSASREYAKLL